MLAATKLAMRVPQRQLVRAMPRTPKLQLRSFALQAAAPRAATAAADVVAPAAASDGIVNNEKSRQLMHQYWKLSKGKLTVWVALSALPGYFVAVAGSLDPVVLASLCVGTFLSSASAQAMNQIYEVKRDAVMKRTKARPLPSGKLSMVEAKIFAAGSGSLGLAVLAAGATPASAAVAGATWVTYVGAYTPLKVVTPYNTHVGAISGSLPTLLGFTAALGSGLAGSPWAVHAAWVFVMQTLWQMPHFYALAWLHRADYKRGGYKMFPLDDPTGHATALRSKPYLVALCVLPWTAPMLGVSSWMLPVGCAVPSLMWWRSLKKFEHNPSPKTCRRFFLDSLSYLLGTLALFTVYARAEVALPAEEESAAASLDGEATIIGPEWRAAVHAHFVEMCPHEQVRDRLFGLMSGSCPFSGRGQTDDSGPHRTTETA